MAKLEGKTWFYKWWYNFISIISSLCLLYRLLYQNHPNRWIHLHLKMNHRQINKKMTFHYLVFLPLWMEKGHVWGCNLCRHSVHVAQRNELPRWSHEGGDIQANLCPTLYPIRDFDKPKVSFFRILSTYMSICPYFRVFVHPYEYMSTFSNNIF